MNHRHHPPVQESEGNEALLALSKAIVFNSQRVSLKHHWDVYKINAMFANIG